jgi:hypothetical protein
MPPTHRYPNFDFAFAESVPLAQYFVFTGKLQGKNGFASFQKNPGEDG